MEEFNPYYDYESEGRPNVTVNYEQGLENKMYEDALLGFILIEPERMLDVVEILPDASFFADPTNRAAYAIFLDLHAKDAFPSDPALTIRELYTGGNAKNKKHFTTMAEAERYVVSLLDAPISNKFDPNLYKEYAQRIKWTNDVLKIKGVAMSLLSEVEKVPFNEREEFISAAETKFGDITMSVHDKEGLVHISDMTNSVRTVLENFHQGIAPTAGVKTGIGSIDRMIGGFNPGEVIVLAARPAAGKANVNGTKVYTTAGLKNIEDIRANEDRVYNRFGQPVDVIGVFPQGKLRVYKVVLEDGREVLCNDEHIWAVCRDDTREGRAIVRLQNMTVREMLDAPAGEFCFSIPMNGAVELPERELPSNPYEMGRTLGESGNRIPEEYLLASIDQRRELLRGLVEAVGLVGEGHVKLRFAEGPDVLVKDVRRLVFSLGIPNTLTEEDGQCVLDMSCSEKLEADSACATVGIERIENLGYEAEMTCLYVVDPSADLSLREEYDSIIGETDGNRHPDEHVFLVGEECIPTHNTALSLQIAYNIASRPNDVDGKRNAVLMFSLEMMEDQLVNRMIALMARVNTDMFNKEYQKLLQGYYRETWSASYEKQMKDKLEEQYWRSIIALKHLDTLPFYSTTTSGLSVNAIKSMILQKQREVSKKGQKLGLVIIDYLQLMTPGLTKANASRTEEVGDMSRRIKVIAKEFNVPILLLAQLNRDAEVNERPQLKNLRESGSIEQDADKVMFIYNPNALKTAAEFTDYQDDNAKYEALNRELMKEFISVAKNRQGNSGDCEVLFDKGFQTFVSQSDGYSGGGETFDEFAIKYYDKTRSGADIFWPLTDDKMIPELLQHRSPEIQELPWLKSDGTVQYSKDKPSGSMRVQSSRPARPNPGYTPPQQQAKPQYDKSAPAALPELDDLETEFGELEEEETPQYTGTAPTYRPPGVEAEEEEFDDVPWDVEEPAPAPAQAPAYSFDEEDEDIDLDDLELLNALSQELGNE